MRIAELVNNLEIGGAERMVVDLSLGLRARGHEVHVTCLRGGGALAAGLEQAGIAVTTFRKAGGASWKTVRNLARYYRWNQIEIVHTHNPLVHHYGVVAAVLGSAAGVVNTVHGPANIGKWGSALMMFEACCLKSDRVVACCEAVGRHVRQRTVIARRKTTVIANGIPLEKFVSVERRPIGSEFVFGVVGRLVSVKDHQTLLRALARVAGGSGHCRLEILGDGPLRTDLEQQAVALGLGRRVLFHGSSLAVPEFLGRVDAFILCSTSEGLPLTVLEAMATGLPVIGTKVGAIPELVEKAKCGWICDVGDVASIAAAMRTAMNCKALPEMGYRARETALAGYSIEGMTASYERVFAEILAKQRGRADYSACL